MDDARNETSSEQKTQPAVSSTLTSDQRVISIDALRGFDMFWIVGGEQIIHSLRGITGVGIVKLIDAQFFHADWEGLTFYDLIFPLFVFIVGVSLVFSLGRITERRGKQAAYKRIVKRSIILFVIGILYSTGPVASLEDVRIMGVLQRIALSYLFAGLLFCALKPRFLVIVFAAILVGYWAMMTFIPVPGVGAGNFQESVNLANYVDQQYLPLKKYDGDYDPEGLLSTIPAIGTCLLGVFAGLLLRDEAVSDRERVKRLLLFGFASILLGLLWGTHFPVIKKIWTSSYVLVTGGCSFLLLGIFYQIIEIWKVRKWTKPFVWIGMNSIALYLVSGFLYMLIFFVFGLNFEAISGCGGLIFNLLYICLILTIAYALFRWKIFLRV